MDAQATALAAALLQLAEDYAVLIKAAMIGGGN